ncbi:MAG: signal recognition particle-docking protein FtsY, partial [Bdellovibrionales bacterium]|nr:signal recognition particle-docking protein FtsY [Bdellovibrionales bacterium]
GTGKTTTIGKLGQQFTREGKKVMLAAGDTFRAAAVAQLKVWGERIGCPVVSKDEGADAAALAYEAIDRAEAEGVDVLMIDTAGRLQNKQNLMEELSKIVRVIRKKNAAAPHAILLVLDATVGQNAHSQLELFKEMVAITGLVVTKLDGTAKGGVLVSLAERFNLPVHAIGIGEGIDDLRPFAAADYARAIVGFDAAAPEKAA